MIMLGLLAWLFFLAGEARWIEMGMNFLALWAMGHQWKAREDLRTETTLPRAYLYLLVGSLFFWSVKTYKHREFVD